MWEPVFQGQGGRTMLRTMTLLALLFGVGQLPAQSQWRASLPKPSESGPSELQPTSAFEPQQHPAMPHKTHTVEQTPTTTGQSPATDANPPAADTPEAEKAKAAAAM